MSKTILNRLNQILVEKLYGTKTGAHNVDAGNKINRTYDASAPYRPTNAQVVDELRLVFKKGSGSDASADYSKYKGGDVTQDLKPLFKQTLIEVTFPAGYFSKASGCAQSMFITLRRSKKSTSHSLIHLTGHRSIRRFTTATASKSSSRRRTLSVITAHRSIST